MMEEILRQIAPGATHYVVLLTLGVISIQIAKYFKEKESEFYNKYLEMYSELRKEFKEAYLEPIVAKYIGNSVKSTFEATLRLVDRNMKKGPESPEDIKEPDKIKDILDSFRLQRPRDEYFKEVIENEPSLSSEGFLESVVGSQFLEDIEKNITKVSDVLSYFNKTKYYIKFVYIVLFALSITFFIGLLNLLMDPLPVYIIFSYINLAILLVVASIYGFIRYYNSEQKFLRMYENSKLYPNTQ